jgi:hypothetical protein
MKELAECRPFTGGKQPLRSVVSLFFHKNPGGRGGGVQTHQTVQNDSKFVPASSLPLFPQKKKRKKEKKRKDGKRH